MIEPSAMEFKLIPISYLMEWVLFLNDALFIDPKYRNFKVSRKSHQDRQRTYDQRVNH